MNSLFRVSAISSFLAVYETQIKHPEWTFDEVRRAMVAASYMGQSVDWSGVVRLAAIVDDNPLPNDRSAAFRLCLSKLIEAVRPEWITVIFSGRNLAARSLDPDVVQCFEVAGLFEEFPSDEVVEWLDSLSIIAQGVRNADNMAKGRQAERLSLNYERARLTSANIDRQVEWVALNENAAGYDIRSWIELDGQILPKLVEVKAHSGSRISFYITRNEWDTAMASHCPYVFQVWSLSNQTLLELTVAALTEHIPPDSGKGRWQSIKIEL
jgi:hypothetical protein